MDTHNILSILQKYIHTTVVATVDDKGLPHTCAIDMMLLEDDYLYFITAKGKAFYQRLINHPHIALTGLKGENTMSSIAISLEGKVKNIGKEKLVDIFEKNPYMKKIYPDEDARDVLEVFQIIECTGEYFDLSQKPIVRIPFAVNKPLKTHGYVVKKECVGCQLCYQVCPQKCINISMIPVTIHQNHCLHCGKCVDICPQHAIRKEIL